MSNISKAFESGKALIPFFTCGDPDLATTAAAIRAAVQNGAAMLEVAIPFSDPTAEGPIIQASNLRALAAGMTTDKVFAFLKELREDVMAPVVLVVYANVVFSYGVERFVAACAACGVDGLLVQDLPLEEREEFQPVCRKYGVDLVGVIAPTSGARAAEIARAAEGMVYVQASLNAAAPTAETLRSLAETVRVVRENTDLPCAVHYGLLAPELTAECFALADGVSVDLEIVRLFEAHGKNAPEQVGAFVRALGAAGN